jgi:hypothetical protein
MANHDAGPLSLSQTLRDEIAAVHGETAGARLDETLAAYPPHAPGGRRHDDREDPRRLAAVYEAAHELGTTALCLSGGGIRSASFALGVIQGLAEKGMLQSFQYLSTVSGGGYIGSWLSAWLHWSKNADAVCEALVRKDEYGAPLPDEPAPIAHLRAHSNYLTPKLGLVSADTWAATAIYLRNLLLNWIVLLPLLALVAVLPKWVGALAHLMQDPSALECLPEWIRALGELMRLPPGSQLLPELAYAACGILIVAALAFSTCSRYAGSADPRARHDGAGQGAFLLFDLIPAVLAGAFFAWIVNRPQGAVVGFGFLTVEAPTFCRFVFAGAILYAIGLGVGGMWRLGADWARLSRPAHGGARLPAGSDSLPRRPVADRPATRVFWDVLMWPVAGAAFGAMLWVGSYAYRSIDPVGVTLIGQPCLQGSLTVAKQTVLIILGMPWFLLAMLAGQMSFLCLRSKSPLGDYEREWLGRAGGWYLAVAVLWIVMASLVLLGSSLLAATHLGDYSKWLAPLGGLSGIASALLGSSATTPGRAPALDWKPYLKNVALALAGPVFAAIAIIYISVSFDSIVFHRAFQDTVLYSATANCPIPTSTSQPPDLLNDLASYCDAWSRLGIATGVLIVIELFAGFFVNINRFSLHALYRNRLIRAFLGGPHEAAPAGEKRRPNRFTGFDESDNIRMVELWPGQGPLAGARWRPFHVVNIALNVVATRNLAWQQRKAESFTVTPRHCGAERLGYRRTEDYGYRDGRGISLGTALAISGAAASPNMGYHSSPSVTFLLAVFNVRLGWWLGNPGRAGASTYRRDGPRLASRPFVSELFGLTSDDSPYVYLSDGGHFENLGLYEMVRRRCRWIVLSDAGQDGTYDFADLGNAVRKIWIDLGIRIAFPTLNLFEEQESTVWKRPRFAVGTVTYPEPGAPQGKILYVKPVVRGDEPADIVAYARENEPFPHESTADQMFDEAQLESYRALGYWTVCELVRASGATGLSAIIAALEARDPTTV